MATQLSYPETNGTVANDIAPKISIDYANRFTEGIRQLTKLLGFCEPIPVQSGSTIKTYKYTTDIKDGNVAEGEYIPLSKVSRAVDKTHEMKLSKWRRNTSAEAIQEHGRDKAINDTDARFIGAVQSKLKADLFTAITSTEKTSPAGKTLQESLANLWAALTTIFEDYDGFADPDADQGEAKFVYFVNPQDVAAYLGTASVTTQTAFGMSYIKDFLGLGHAFTTSKVKKGEVFGTAAQNIKVAYVPANGSDLAQTFGLVSDATGMVGMNHSVNATNASIDTLVMGDWKVFPEVEDAVLKGTITPLP